MGLVLHLGSGEAVDPAEAAAWSAGPDGIEFITRSSRGWADASVEAGTPEAEARAAEQGSTGSYTGAPTA